MEEFKVLERIIEEEKPKNPASTSSVEGGTTAGASLAVLSSRIQNPIE
jgi:hypothetical protein